MRLLRGNEKSQGVHTLRHPSSTLRLSKKKSRFESAIKALTFETMATVEALKRDELDVLSSSIFDTKGGKSKARGKLIEKKIDFLETLSGKISNRRTRRWLNDRFLIELVPRLDAEEIRGLFAPPPWGDDVPLSAFSMTNGEEWDSFRNVDMDKESIMIDSLQSSSTKKKGHVDAEKMEALSAWYRIDCRTREALRRSFLPELIESYEECLLEFLKEDEDREMLVLQVQDPFHRLVLHGVCEFYDLLSVTDTSSNDGKMSKVTTIKKKKAGCAQVPEIPLSVFLKMLKEGIW